MDLSGQNDEWLAVHETPLAKTADDLALGEVRVQVTSPRTYGILDVEIEWKDAAKLINLKVSFANLRVLERHLREVVYDMAMTLPPLPSPLSWWFCTNSYVLQLCSEIAKFIKYVAETHVPVLFDVLLPDDEDAATQQLVEDGRTFHLKHLRTEIDALIVTLNSGTLFSTEAYLSTAKAVSKLSVELLTELSKQTFVKIKEIEDRADNPQPDDETTLIELKTQSSAQRAFVEMIQKEIRNACNKAKELSPPALASKTLISTLEFTEPNKELAALQDRFRVAEYEAQLQQLRLLARAALAKFMRLAEDPDMEVDIEERVQNATKDVLATKINECGLQIAYTSERLEEARLLRRQLEMQRPSQTKATMEAHTAREKAADAAIADLSKRFARYTGYQKKMQDSLRQYGEKLDIVEKKKTYHSKPHQKKLAREERDRQALEQHGDFLKTTTQRIKERQSTNASASMKSKSGKKNKRPDFVVDTNPIVYDDDKLKLEESPKEDAHPANGSDGSEDDSGSDSDEASGSAPPPPPPPPPPALDDASTVAKPLVKGVASPSSSRRGAGAAEMPSKLVSSGDLQNMLGKLKKPEPIEKPKPAANDLQSVLINRMAELRNVMEPDDPLDAKEWM